MTLNHMKLVNKLPHTGKNEHTIKLIGLCKEVSNNRPIINLF